ncbi:mannose-1-phosphate guanylyltransferase [bacterium]|nr:mannose-1-phosphate guanylyltransferase [bacterium]
MSDDRTGTTINGFCVIMAGGRGTRFWPLSRTRRPKQLLPLGQGASLLRDTFDRVRSLVGDDRVLVVTNAAQAEATAAALPELPPERIVAEPVGRNTAACAALGAGLAAGLVGDGPVALLPADHLIPDPEVFRDQLAAAFRLAETGGGVITFGIPPRHPSTGFGYIEVPRPPAGDEAVDGLRFVEKPDADTAREYVDCGRFLWNSGIFVWHSADLAREIAAHEPEISRLLEAPLGAHGSDKFTGALSKAYETCPAVSIDVAVMEKLAGFRVMGARFGWSDLGSWDAWREFAPQLADGNRGHVRLLAGDGRANTVFAPGKAVALLGVEDLIIVDTEDALLICTADAAQRIKEITGKLEENGELDLL